MFCAVDPGGWEFLWNYCLFQAAHLVLRSIRRASHIKYYRLRARRGELTSGLADPLLGSATQDQHNLSRWRRLGLLLIGYPIGLP